MCSLAVQLQSERWQGAADLRHLLQYHTKITSLITTTVVTPQKQKVTLEPQLSPSHNNNANGGWCVFVDNI